MKTAACEGQGMAEGVPVRQIVPAMAVKMPAMGSD